MWPLVRSTRIQRQSTVATSFPAYDLARAVCGQAAEITLLLPPGAESHSYEPTPRDILAVWLGGTVMLVLLRRLRRTRPPANK